MTYKSDTNRQAVEDAAVIRGCMSAFILLIFMAMMVVGLIGLIKLVF